MSKRSPYIGFFTRLTLLWFQLLRTILPIDEYVYDPSTNGGKLVMSVGGGVARFVSGNMKKENIKIRTATATMGLRG